MTRVYGQVVICPKCHTVHTAETQFSREIRNEPTLRSSIGFAAADIDCDTQRLIWHRFKDGGSRAVQMMMDIEIKTRGADLTDSERDTLHMENQVIRNRRETPTKKKRFESGQAPIKVLSLINKRNVYLRHFGVHALRFSGTGWTDSEWIEWDKRMITKEILLKLLRFEIDPDSFHRIEVRPHHARERQPELPLGIRHAP